MRITEVTTSNIAGLADAATELDANIIAIAGPNGVGKSRLLLCAIAPWVGDIPPPKNNDEPSTVSVTVAFSQIEREEIRLRGLEGWNEGDSVPEKITFTYERRPRVGVSRTMEPLRVALDSAFSAPQFLARVPSLDVLFLPAERRLASDDVGSVRLELLGAEEMRRQLAATRNQAFHRSGQIDDAEVQAYLRALCVAAHLPDDLEGDHEAPDPLAEWEAFKSAADTLLAPKCLEPLTRRTPDRLLVRVDEGEAHPISALSSGERQSFIILGKVFQSGRGGSPVIIDEPDLHLHPRLGVQLFEALTKIEPTQLIVATHAPFILDQLRPDAILEMRHNEPPRYLSSDADRVVAYRSFGFKASEITQTRGFCLPKVSLMENCWAASTGAWRLRAQEQLAAEHECYRPSRLWRIST